MIIKIDSKIWIKCFVSLSVNLNGKTISKKLYDDYSIVKWKRTEEIPSMIELSYTDEQLIALFLLKWS